MTRLIDKELVDRMMSLEGRKSVAIYEAQATDGNALQGINGVRSMIESPLTSIRIRKG